LVYSSIYNIKTYSSQSTLFDIKNFILYFNYVFYEKRLKIFIRGENFWLNSIVNNQKIRPELGGNAMMSL